MKRMGFSAGIVACLMLVGCGGGSDDSGGGTTPPPPPPPAGIGSAGGTVSEASGAKVVIPAGALTANTDIKVTQTSTGAPALPTGVTAAGSIYAFTPHGTAFAKAVTITVPFDSTKIAAGATATLFKTDASLSTWAEVPGATVTGNTMSGDVTGFSDVVVGSKPLATQFLFGRKDWTIGTSREDADELNILAHSKFNTGDAGAVDAFKEYGSTLPFEDLPAASAVFSTEDSKHYYVFAEAPKPGDSDPRDLNGAQSDLNLTNTYIKNASDATLRFTISDITLDTIHSHGVSGDIRKFLCDWLPEPNTDPDPGDHCVNFQINTEVGITVTAYTFLEEKVFYGVGGSVLLSGLGGDWHLRAFNVAHSDLYLQPDSLQTELPHDSIVFDRLWNKAAFVLDDGDDSAEVTLAGPVTVNVPLDRIPTGSTFTVETYAIARSVNRVQGESQASAFLRDPVDTGGGVKVEFTGLTPVEPQRIPETHKTLHPCTGAPDPAAGHVQFTAADFSALEARPAQGQVTLERTGGSTGEIGVQFETSDGTAQAGSDYLRTRRVVWFNDGQDGDRTIAIPIVLDAIEEPSSETANLTLTVVSGCAALGSQSTATLTIFDTDKPVPVTPTFTLGGTVTGLQGSGLHLQTNFINDVSPTTDGAFTFPRVLDDGTAYAITIVTQPSNPAQVCTLTNGSGTIAGANVTNVGVSCTIPPPPSGLDSGFGAQGKVFNANSSARVLKLQADGKLLALGNLTLNRYNADGTLDTSFGTGGKIDIVTGGAAIDKMMALTVQPDGKILVVGNTQLPTVPGIDFITLRYNADGTPDPTFGFGTGMVKTDFDGARDEATGVFVQGDDKIVVTGDVQIHKTVNQGGVVVDIVDQDYGALRYLPDGHLDLGFGTDGKTSVDVGGLDTANAVARAFGDSFLIVGRVQVSGGTGNPDMGIVKFFSNGRIDTGFGNGGTERIDVGTGVVPGSFGGGNTDEALDVAVQRDEKILLAGYNFVLVNNRFVPVAAMFRLTETGAIEHNFQAVIPTAINEVTGVDLQRTDKLGDLKIVIAGITGTDFGLARFNMDGALDTSFGDNGLLTVDFFGGTDVTQDVIVQPDGKIVAGGSAKNGTGGGAGLVRVNP